MNEFAIKIWNEFWVAKDFYPIAEKIPVLYGGTNTEPEASIGMACFLDPIRDKFHNGFSILDYGCGAGILANFISERLEEFTYIGIEATTLHGQERITAGRELLNDSRIKFGFDRDPDFWKGQYDLVTLISVLTHLTPNKIDLVLQNLQELVKLNPSIVITFSCFLGDQYEAIGPEPHIADEFYGKVIYPKENIVELFNNYDLTIQQYGEFHTDGHIHSLFRVN